MKKEEKIKNQIQVGDRVTYIQIKQIISSTSFYDFKTEEVKNKVTEIVTDSNEEFKEILKIERIGQNGWYTVYEKESEILDEKEKEYLSNIIKPFKNRILGIIKETTACVSPVRIKKMEQIVIKVKNEYSIIMPVFKKNTMYKNMKTNKQYTLKELGLE